MSVYIYVNVVSLIQVSRKEEGKDGKTNPQKHAARLGMLKCASQGKTINTTAPYRPF
jgi:hypothetical protein